VRRVLRACGFDLSMALFAYAPDEAREARLAELRRLTPKERLDAALTRGGAEQMGYPLDPYAILAALEEARVNYILIGSLARVLRGADEIPAGLDLTLSKRAAQAGDQALHAFGMRAPGASHRSGDALVYWSQVGVTQTVAEPQGTSGYDDLRRRPSASTSARVFVPAWRRQATWCGCSRRSGVPSR
jgi:hypothetical protein